MSDAEKNKNTTSMNAKNPDKTADLKELKTSSYCEQNGFEFLNLKPESIIQGLVLSEIIGRPRSLRRGRW